MMKTVINMLCEICIRCMEKKKENGTVTDNICIRCMEKKKENGTLTGNIWPNVSDNI